VLWEASDRICGKRLRPLVPVMLEAMGYLDRSDWFADLPGDLRRVVWALGRVGPSWHHSDTV